MTTLTTVQLAIYFVAILIFICGIAGTMEVYKKTIRKGKAKAWENYLIALILTIISLVLLEVSNVFQPALVTIGGSVWMDWILYVILVYIAQFQLDKKVIKKIIRSFAENFLEKAGLEEDQIKDILSNN